MVQGSVPWPWVYLMQSPVGSWHPRAAVSLCMLPPAQSRWQRLPPDPTQEPRAKSALTHKASVDWSFLAATQQGTHIFPFSGVSVLATPSLACSERVPALKGRRGEDFRAWSPSGPLGCLRLDNQGFPPPCWPGHQVGWESLPAKHLSPCLCCVALGVRG